jgi:CBS domain-containing protein
MTGRAPFEGEQAMNISDVLRRKGSQVTTVLDTARVAEAVGIFAERKLGAVVVLDRWTKIAGIFSERDLVNALARQGAPALDLEVSALMTRAVITCAPDDRVDAILGRMTMNRIRHLPVLEDGRLAGIVSIGDLVHQRLGEKELEAGVLLDIARMRA